MLRWADARFAHRFAGGPPPPRRPRYGEARTRHERRQWFRHLLAWATGCALLLGGTALVGDLGRAAPLLQVAILWTVVLAVDLAISFSYTLFPKRAPER
jgi:hypothetical protein